MKKFAYRLAVTVVFILTACGGGGGGNGDGAGKPGDARGALLEAPAIVATLTAGEIDALAEARGIAMLAGAARCDVRLASIDFRTPDVQGGSSNVSGVLLLPVGPCAGQPHSLLGYGRSTEVYRPRTLASASDADTQMLAMMYAAQGIAVVAPDYLGFAKSGHAFHPFLHADSEATTLVDALRAGRTAAAQLGAKLSGRVLLAGYSQGAHASMAAQRAIEQSHAAEFPLAAAAHMAGAYNLSGLLQRGDAIVGYQYVLPFLLTSWQKLYGNVYASASEAFRAPYASYVENLLPNPTHTFESLRAQGLLPGPEVAPTQARDLLLQSAYLARVQTDASHPLLVAARRNDLNTGWAPRAQTLLCGGLGDPTVSPALHQDTAKAEFDRRGAPAVSSVDVDAAIQALYGPGGRAPTDSSTPEYGSYLAAYHTHLEPPLCHVRARELFDLLR